MSLKIKSIEFSEMYILNLTIIIYIYIYIYYYYVQIQYLYTQSFMFFLFDINFGEKIVSFTFKFFIGNLICYKGK